MPTAIPTAVNPTPLPPTSARMSPGCAPRATRTPISEVCWVTKYRNEPVDSDDSEHYGEGCECNEHHCADAPGRHLVIEKISQKADVGDGEHPIDRVHFACDCRYESGRIPGRPNHEISGRKPRLRVELTIRHVHFRTRRQVEPHLAHVADYAHDREPRRTRPVGRLESAADRTVAAEVRVRHRLIDDDNWLGVAAVGLGEITTGDERDANRLEIGSADLPEVGLVLDPGWGARPSMMKSVVAPFHARGTDVE